MMEVVVTTLCVIALLISSPVCGQGLPSVEPEEKLIGIFLIQILPRAPIPYRDLFKAVVYQAITH